MTGAAAELVALIALIGLHDAVPPARRGLVTGVFLSGTIAGITVGALATGHVADARSLEFAMAANAVAGAIAVVWLVALARRAPSAR